MKVKLPIYKNDVPDQLYAIPINLEGALLLAPAGCVARVDEELCLACGECLDVCQIGALRYTTEEEMRHRLYGMVVDEEKCNGCGMCVGVCENQGISLIRASQKMESPEGIRLPAQAE